MRNEMSANVILTGGTSMFPGMAERLERALTTNDGGGPPHAVKVINQSLSRSPRSSSASSMLRSHSPPTDSLVFAKAEAEEECCAALDYDDDASSEDEEEPKFQVQKKEKKEAEKEEKKEEKAGPPPAQMRDIIMKQKASGSWDWSDAAGLVGLTADKLRSGIPSAKLLTVDKEVEALWATAVVAAFLQKRFPGQKTNWDLVVKKALKFIARQKKNVKLASESEEIDWVQLATAFLP
ncbi:uncharacterized protein ACA1_382650 [Acanthamoeba castellanii str. Neff]|uniref:Uncharacterized protein n=1 Tax=Acanthamoeba castellanii (strain ATCC 30010 / Neff) TaxID=1257118 RepID=L8GUW0_ACACF|nr:uncharacterized protein ACA1_382650 [Acanthamoeba castellanii str. Neff]ELR16785.1 hypothetical protein ACA1_382650 [Acanthamoeba castellanii str. Neff]